MAWSRKALNLVLAQELGKDAVLVVGREVHMLDLDAQHIGHAGRIQKVLTAGAELAVVIVFPVLHEDADDLMALLLQKVRRHGGINPAAQAHHHTVTGIGRHGMLQAARAAAGGENRLSWAVRMFRG